MQELVGKRVWVVQHDDDDTSISGYVSAIADGFIALRQEGDTEPTLYVNLNAVTEIEVVRPEGDGQLRLLRFPAEDGEVPS